MAPRGTFRRVSYHEMWATVEDVATQLPDLSVGSVRLAFHALSWGGQEDEPTTKKSNDAALRIRGLRKDGYGRAASIQECQP